MQKFGVMLAALSLLWGCGQSWSDADREKYLKDCKGNDFPGLTSGQADEYCNCQLDVMEEHFKTYDDMHKAGEGMPEEKRVELAKAMQDCLPKE